MSEGYKREWICCFCMSVSDITGDLSPDQCVCQVKKCMNCSSWLKGNHPSFCYGCGAICPKVEARFVGSDQTAAVYIERAWMELNIGKSSDGKYSIGTGRDGSFLMKEIGDKYLDVRKLTEEELEAWRGNYKRLQNGQSGQETSTQTEASGQA